MGALFIWITTRIVYTVRTIGQETGYLLLRRAFLFLSFFFCPSPSTISFVHNCRDIGLQPCFHCQIYHIVVTFFISLDLEQL